eukprot:m.158490 g.158490  ORF g.158490 m.158490 type:complete len:331 (-) comp15138_c0_seq3:56-1048(-)
MACIAVVLVVAFAVVSVEGSIPNVILDTDMSTDCDDVGALCILHAMEQRGEANIIATVHNTGLPIGAAAISVINHYYGRDDIQIGAYKGPFDQDVPGPYVPHLVTAFPSPVKNYSQVPDAVEVYRKALAEADDASVVISSIGFTTNLEALLQSGPDAYSPLNGKDLVAKKVALIAWMGGRYPNSTSGTGPSPEHNFGYHNIGNSTSFVATNWPTSVAVVWSGWELGAPVETGGVMTAKLPVSNPCRQAYIDHSGAGNNRSSWDPLTTLYAVRGLQDYWSESEKGYNNVSSDGNNVFSVTKQPTLQVYLKQKMDPLGVAAAIDELLLQPPK